MPGEAVVTIRDKQWSCWVASTPEELATGLSGVPSIAPGTGMLFILPQEQIVTVTAEGMLFPVSIIFIGGNLLVTEVALSLYPDDWGTTSLPCKYFLEVNFNEATGIKSGDMVSIQIAQVPGATDWMTPVITLAGVAMVGVMMVNMGKTMADAMLEKSKRPERILPQAAVIPIAPRERRRATPGELEFLPDSPEFLAYTIDDIGYRDRIDSAFLQAIARAKQGR